METVKQKLQKYLLLDAWQRWEYKHTTFILIFLVLFIILLDTSLLITSMDLIKKLGYVGVLFSGVLFTSLFTAAPAVVLLLGFTELNPFLLAAVAAAGAMIGDYLILRYVEYDVAYELKPLAYRFGIPQAVSYLQGRKATLGIVRLLGAFIIASPLPDEIGIGLLGMGKLNKVSFFAICYALNVGGILVLILAARGLA